ncbi:MAG: S-methyl-5-thioribose-1-phosphate isomerase [Candidatus Thiodiazotropha sp. (ex Dulcina madagascariensis)]|nr:S-methyl-5-thioribose-1-phosphate isomerase [Candidatus Thiodiazotropha sp. (ex Dulcina madagascariensis)]MCU7927858.1 S-methyl-5-thioribose-1-phosphate isomerase [Candidatus Thiodiazotropha sp. (ex Dulcina madagascariensis)]
MDASNIPTQARPDDAIVWRDGRLFLLDQRYLPERGEFLELKTASATARAIRAMVVRGAPAIGITAAYGVVLAGATAYRRSKQGWQSVIQADLNELRQSRPTAVNLFWALRRMEALIGQLPKEGNPRDALLQEAMLIHREDVMANRQMGEAGAALIKAATAVITHCNAGALATGGYGTALGVIRAAHGKGRIREVLADETRPWLQGARLTAWELLQDGIPVTLLADGAAASRMTRGDVGWVIVGSDRIAANGDVANKIGTYSLAVAAKHHGVKVMVVAPTSTIDMSLPSGREIPIEVRDADELRYCGGRQVAAQGASAWNPVFDVTPAELVDAIVTERGVVCLPDEKKMEKLMIS